MSAVSRPIYELIYFPVRWRGELIRLVFHAAQQDFVDTRINADEWEKLKSTVPFGKLPVLKTKDFAINQSISIADYLARKFGLAGNTPEDALKCNALVQNIVDMSMPAAEKVYAANDEAKKKQVLKQDFEPAALKLLDTFEDYLAKCPKKTGSGSSFLVADKLTYTDLQLYHTVYLIVDWCGANLIEKYPLITKHFETTSSHPNLKVYLESRPKTAL